MKLALVAASAPEEWPLRNNVRFILVNVIVFTDFILYIRPWLFQIYMVELVKFTVTTISDRSPILILILVKERMVGTKNIEKITKSMKMVSAAKLRGDQQRLAAAKPFSV